MVELILYITNTTVEHFQSLCKFFLLVTGFALMAQFPIADTNKLIQNEWNFIAIVLDTKTNQNTFLVNEAFGHSTEEVCL